MLRNTLENGKLQNQICFIAINNLHDLIWTKKEQKILSDYYLLGNSQREIGKQIKVSRQTIQTRREKALKKMAWLPCKVIR